MFARIVSVIGALMRALPIALVVICGIGCSVAEREPLILDPSFRKDNVGSVLLVFEFSGPDRVGRENAEAFVNGVKNSVERHNWTISRDAFASPNTQFDAKGDVQEYIGKLEVDGRQGWIVVSQLDVGSALVMPSATGDSRGTVFIPNPTIALTVTVRCALIDVGRAKIVWMDEEQAGPEVDGVAMDYDEFTPQLVSTMIKQVFRSLKSAPQD